MNRGFPPLARNRLRQPVVPGQPFGGYKMSGIGSKAGGPDYLKQFLIPVNITENTLCRGFAPAAEGE